MLELAIQPRTILGKRTRSLRAQGVVPAEVFGFGISNIHASVTEKDFRKVFAKAQKNTVISLAQKGGENLAVLISDVTYHPISGSVLSVDFHKVQLDKKIRAEVPVIFTGEAPAIKNGLIIVHVTTQIEVESLPQSIPHEFNVSLESLSSVGDSIYVKNLVVPSEVKLITPHEMVLVTVTQKEEEVVETPVATATPETASTSTEEAAPASPEASK